MKYKPGVISGLFLAKRDVHINFKSSRYTLSYIYQVNRLRKLFLRNGKIRQISKNGLLEGPDFRVFRMGEELKNIIDLTYQDHKAGTSLSTYTVEGLPVILGL